MLVFLRVSALLTVFPLLSAAGVPRQVRIALGAMTAFLLAPMVPGLATPNLDLWKALGLMMSEILFGLLLGFTSRMFMHGIEVGGAIVAMEMGLTMPGGLNPFTNQTSSEAATILQYLGGMLFLTMNLHHGLLVALQRSYQFLPLGGGHFREGLVVEIFARTNHLFWFALEMAAPVLAVSFLLTLIFSVLSRAVPQMNVFAEHFGARLLAGLTVFGLTCHLMAEHIANYLRRLPEDVLRVAQLLGA